jgi:hypothetical protein
MARKYLLTWLGAGGGVSFGDGPTFSRERVGEWIADGRAHHAKGHAVSGDGGYTRVNDLAVYCAITGAGPARPSTSRWSCRT